MLCLTSLSADLAISGVNNNHYHLWVKLFLVNRAEIFLERLSSQS